MTPRRVLVIIYSKSIVNLDENGNIVSITYGPEIDRFWKWEE